MKDHFTITSGVLPAETRVASFKGIEALSTPYSFEVNLIVPSEDDIELEDVVGDRVTLTLEPEGGHVVCGVIATFELLAEASGYGLFRATVVPKLWYLTLTHHSRVFVDESVKDIIEKILKKNDFTTADYKFKTNGKYAKYDHVCQYQESDFNFISRWMEREGLYYFFEHGDSGEVLVITDDKSFHKPSPEKAVRYVAQMGQDSSAGASLDTFVCRRTTLPTKVALKDYDYLKPKLDVSGSAPVSHTGQGEVHVYGENFTTPDDGKRLAKLRAEKMLAGETRYTGEGRVYGLSAGHTFTLDEHPRTAFNVEYLATAVHHYGNQSSSTSAFQKLLEIEHDEPYHVRVEAIPAKIQFRPARVTPIPRIYGTEEAVIDAEDGVVYAELDDHGRYKVKIFFDETDLEDGKASMWIRMLQPHGGDVEGFHFPLRKGTEVHLVFLGGDPDRPVIAGVAHNAVNPSVVRQKNNTRNVIQTGGKNRIEMEDNEGAQYMHMKTEPKGTFFFMGATGATDLGKDKPPSDHNVHLSTDGTGRIFTDSNMTIEVGTGDMEINVHTGTSLHHVTGTVIENFEDTVNHYYGKRHSISVISGGRYESVTDGYEQYISAGKGFHQEIEGGAGYFCKADPNYVLNVKDLWDVTATDVKWTISKDVKITCKEWDCTQEGEVKWKTIGNFSHMHAENKLEVILGSKSEMIIGADTAICVGMQNEVTVGMKNELVIANLNELSLSFGLEYKASPHIAKENLKMKMLEITVEEMDAELTDAKTAIKNITCAIDKGTTRIYNSVTFIYA